MVSRPKKKSTQKVKNLKLKSLGADQAKNVKGGPSCGPWSPVQKVQKV